MRTSTFGVAGTLAEMCWPSATGTSSFEAFDVPAEEPSPTLEDVHGGGNAAPSGTVTFLFTDIEGSTRLVEQLGDAYGAVLESHQQAVFAAVSARGGHPMGSEGDACFAAFARASDAVGAALEVQRAALTATAAAPPRTRVGIHTGEAALTPAGYVGITVHKTARIRDAAHGGQVLLSDTTRRLAEGAMPPLASVKDLGSHRFKDLGQPERLFQLLHPDLDGEFPRLRTLEAVANNLPVQLTSFVGRDREVDEVKRLLTTARLITLVGPGGSGKTRLALQVAAQVVDQYADGAWLIDLAATTDGSVIPETVASILGVRGAARAVTTAAGAGVAEREAHGNLLDQVLDRLRSSRALLIVDNCEHLVTECAVMAESILSQCPDVVVLATSREPLRVPGEARWRIPPLATPPARVIGDALAGYEAVQLFVDRARLNQSDFELTPGNAAAVLDICRKLDGMPLAIELAAPWVSTLDPVQILSRLDDQFRLLASGPVRGSPRQQTLRATVDWSYDLLSPAERVLLENLSVFGGGFSLDAAERVCTDSGIERDQVVHLLAQLVDKSLVLRETRPAVRYRLLEVIRQYGWEKVAADTVGTPPTPSAPAVEERSAVLRREGEYWSIGRDDRTFRLRHSKGLEYLDALIRCPGREVHVLELASPAQAPAGFGDAGPALDARARDEYKRRLTDLERDADEARSRGDIGQLEKIELEIDFLTDELARAFGIGGRGRTVNSASERARLSVTKAIRSTIARIDENDADLGGHLRAAIQTGTYCAYRPDPLHRLTWTMQ